jgi:hypothetical protein
MRNMKFLATAILCLVAATSSYGQDDQTPLTIAVRPLQSRDVLLARPKADTPVVLPGGRPAKLDDTPFQASTSISWRSVEPTVEFKLQGPGPFPKTGVFEVYASPPSPVNGSGGLTLSPANQVTITPLTPLYKTSISTAEDGIFTVDLGVFAPKAKRVQLGGLVKTVGNTEDRGASLVDKVAVAKDGTSPVELRVFAPKVKRVQLGGLVKTVGNTDDSGASLGNGTAVAKIETIGFTQYYVRVVNDKGTSSTNATIEYGEQLPPDVPSDLQAKNPVLGGRPWLIDITTTSPVYALRWWTLAPGATSAVFQVSNTPFPDDARTWRLAGLNRATGSVPTGPANGVNEFGLDLTNYLVGGPRSKGDYFLRVVPLKANGDLAAQPSDAIKLHLVAPPSVPLPESSLEIRENPNAPERGEFAEKPLWGASAHLDSSAKFLFRWSTQSSVTNAKVSVRRIDDWSNDLVHEASIDKQGDFELGIGPKMVSPRVYQVTLIPTDESGTQVAQDAKVFVSTPVPSDYHLPLPDPNSPPNAWFNFDVSVVHYEPPKESELYRYVLSHEPTHGSPIDDAFYSLYQQLTGHAEPHRGDKVYLPPKQDNGKSWDEYVADGANFVAKIGSWAQGAASSLNSQIDQVKSVAAKGISSATGGAIPAS